MREGGGEGKGERDRENRHSNQDVWGSRLWTCRTVCGRERLEWTHGVRGEIYNMRRGNICSKRTDRWREKPSEHPDK